MWMNHGSVERSSPEKTAGGIPSTTTNNVADGTLKRNRLESKPPHSHSRGMWTYDSNALGLTTQNDTNHGIIGSNSANFHVSSRLLWNKSNPEEEEREEEALPSYLSYLQPSFVPSVDPLATHEHHAIPSQSFPNSLGQLEIKVEEKTKELAMALQEFVASQVISQKQDIKHRTPTTACRCDALQAQVESLESQLHHVLQMLDNITKGMVTGSINGTMNGNTMSDRVSTLEGRQSAFQSQLAQISRALGIPAGKASKNSQGVKNVIQNMRDDLDSRFSIAIADMEKNLVQRFGQNIIERVTSAVKEEIHSANEPQPTLKYETVLQVLTEEHENSLAKMSSYFEERLLQESKHRIALEERVQSRVGEHEEWLHQLEGEFGSWHDASSTVSSQLRRLQNKIQEVETQRAQDLANLQEKNFRDHANETTSANEIQLVPSPGRSKSSPKRPNESTNSGKSTKSAQTVESLSRSLSQVQLNCKQLQSDFKREMSELWENFVLLENSLESNRQETIDLSKNTRGLKALVEKLVRDTGSAEELLQQYVSTITHQVASVTRQYVSVRIRDNNRLIDATLRARVPAYVQNESESFMLVRPEKNDDEESSVSFVIRDDDEGIRKILNDGVTSDMRTNSKTRTVSTRVATQRK